MIFSKYNASGNDFVISHSFRREDFSEVAKKICNRQSGIGADGLIILIPHQELDFEWLFYNSDGSEAEMCGNGSRATAHYAFSHNLADKKMKFLTGAGVIGCEVDGDIVTTDLTPPKVISKEISEFGKEWWLIDTGVPHLITFQDDISQFSISEARELRYKYNANVNIAKIGKEGIEIRTYERGVENETLACGTGMASAFYRAFLENQVSNSCKVFPKSGDVLELSENSGTLKFKGEVQEVFWTKY